MRSLVLSSGVFALVMTAAALAPTIGLELLALAMVGAASVTFLSQANTTLQLETAPQMRGRVMALWAVAFMGSTPIGGPIAGAVSEHFGARSGLALGAAACVIAAALGVTVMHHHAPGNAPGTEPSGDTTMIVPVQVDAEKS